MCLGEKRFRAEKNQSLWKWVSQLCEIVRYISIIFIHLVLKFTSLQGVYFGFQKTLSIFFLFFSTLFKKKWRRAAMRFGKVSKSFHVEKKMDFSLFKFSWTIHISRNHTYEWKNSRMNCLCACEKWRYEIRTVIGIWIIVKRRSFIGRRRLK